MAGESFRRWLREQIRNARAKESHWESAEETENAVRCAGQAEAYEEVERYLLANAKRH